MAHSTTSEDAGSPTLPVRPVDKRPVHADRPDPENAEAVPTSAVRAGAVPTSAALGLGAAGGIGLGVVGSSVGLRADAAHSYGGAGPEAAGEPFGGGGYGLDPYGTPAHEGASRAVLPDGTYPGESAQDRNVMDVPGTFCVDPSGDGGYPSGGAGGGFPDGGPTSGLLDYDAFAQQSGYGQNHLLEDLTESPVEEAGLDTSTQPDADDDSDQESAGSDAADTGAEQPQDTGDDVVDQAEAHGEALDAEILGNEGAVNNAKAIAEQAQSDRDADSGGDGGGGSAAAGSGRNVLRIDGATLDTLQTTARSVADNFDSASIKAAKNKDRDAVGHYRSLSGAIKSFYDNWSARREGIVKSVKTYADWMDQISEGFEGSDRDLAAGLADSGAFEQDLYAQLREQQGKDDTAAGGDAAPPDTGRRGDAQGLVHTQHSTLQGHYQPPAHSTVDVLRTIERIDGRAAYANYVADYLATSSGFATAGGYIGAGLGADAVAAEGIAALTDLIAFAEQTGQLPAELGFLAFSGAVPADAESEETMPQPPDDGTPDGAPTNETEAPADETQAALR